MFVYFKLLYLYTNLLKFLMCFAHIENIAIDKSKHMVVTLTLTYSHMLSSNSTVRTYSYRYRCPTQTMTNGLEVESQDKYHNMVEYAIRPSKQ